MKLTNAKTGKVIHLDDDLPIRWKETEKILNDLETKYCNLVWWARSDRDKLLREEIYEGIIAQLKIEKEHPKEINDLMNDYTNWTHGFNSGMLAALRLVTGLMSKTIIELDEEELEEYGDDVWLTENDVYVAIFQEDALDEFPFLDT